MALTHSAIAVGTLASLSTELNGQPGAAGIGVLRKNWSAE